MPDDNEKPTDDSGDTSNLPPPEVPPPTFDLVTEGFSEGVFENKGPVEIIREVIKDEK